MKDFRSLELNFFNVKKNGFSLIHSFDVATTGSIRFGEIEFMFRL